MSDVNSFVGVLQDSNVQSQSFALLQSYGTMLMNMLTTGGILGVVSFLIVIFVIKFLLSRFANFPSSLAWLVAGIIAVLTASITVVFVYSFLSRFAGGIV